MKEAKEVNTRVRIHGCGGRLHVASVVIAGAYMSSVRKTQSARKCVPKCHDMNSRLIIRRGVRTELTMEHTNHI